MQAQLAIMEVDPDRKLKATEDYVARGFGVKKVIMISEGATTTVEAYLKLLSRGVCKFATKRDAKDNSAL